MYAGWALDPGIAAEGCYRLLQPHIHMMRVLSEPCSNCQEDMVMHSSRDGMSVGERLTSFGMAPSGRHSFHRVWRSATQLSVYGSSLCQSIRSILYGLSRFKETGHDQADAKCSSASILSLSRLGSA